LLPRILRAEINYEIHDFRKKNHLLSKLPSRLKGYKQLRPDDYKIIVLVDRDSQDCLKLKDKLEDIALKEGFITKSSALVNQNFQVINRIVIEEIESWFFGDINAINSAYPKVSKNISNQASYRIPDQIKGGTWEALERILKKAGYHQGGLQKLKAARDISFFMDPTKNSSKSFQIFYQTLSNL
jgi:hypothetical protein